MSDTVDRIKEFVLHEFLFDDESRMPPLDGSLIESMVIDSTGVLELIEFLESEFGIVIDDSEALTENLDGIGRAAAFVDRKLREAQA